MRVVCVWRRESDYGRAVEEWMMEFERRTGKEIETISPDGRDGAWFCQTYDVVEYPTLLALGDDGSVLAEWRGKMLPTFDEVNYWVQK